MLLLLLGYTFAFVPTSDAQPVVFPTVTVTIHRIQLVDPIESVLEGEADWFFFIGYRPGGVSTYTWSDPVPAPVNEDDVVLDDAHSFEVQADTVEVVIELCEDDTISLDDRADVSSDSGEGVDNLDCNERPSPGTWHPASFHTTYDLVTGSMTGDTVTQELGWWKTSGEFDGSAGGDTNDANVFFDISDNYALPTAQAGPDRTGFTGDTFSFDGTGSTASEGSSIEQYGWDFTGDLVTDVTGPIVSWPFNTKGAHTVTLTVTDSLGKTHSDAAVVTIQNRGPTATFVFGPTNPTVKDDISFADTSTDPDGTIASWSWDFGDGATSTLPDPTHRYATNGPKTVTLTVTDNDGASGSTSQTVTIVNLDPEAGFAFSPPVATTVDTVQFTDTSIDEDGSIIAWSWLFGDGFSSTLSSPSHRYSTKGPMTVTLTVTDNEGAFASISQTINVLNLDPVAGFTHSPSPVTTVDIVQFTDTSLDEDGNVVAWSWDFGDGSSTNLQNPTHNFASPGVYMVTLTVSDNEGGIHSVSLTIEVAQGFPGGTVAGIPIFPVGLVILAVVVVVVVALVLRRRKRKREGSSPPSPES